MSIIKISSKDNSFVKHINKLIKSSKYRRDNREFVAEGLRICGDAYLSGANINAVVYTKKAYEKYRDSIEKIISVADKEYEVTEGVFGCISDTQSPQGVLCIIKTLDKKTLFDKMEYNGKFLALDNIQDPSNLGTILRTAEAVGVSAVILSKDCCDMYSPKVVRGSMGAVFRQNCIIVDTIESFLSENQDLASYAAVVDKNAVEIDKISFKSPCVVCVGNEGNGLKQATVDACGEKITIPMKGRAESLNASVAAGIIMWEMLK